jgi:hypothetical protein
MIIKLFAAWSLAIIASLATANHQGYAVSSLFSGGAQTADKTANHTHK